MPAMTGDDAIVNAPLQTYLPYRKTLLSRDVLRELSVLRPDVAYRDTLWLWLQIFAAWAAVAWFTNWWLVAAAIPFIGTRYYALYIIGHDGLHRRIHPSTRTNDLWNDLFILGPILAITRLNRENHMKHHRMLALPGDPDRYKYESRNKPSRLQALLAFTGLPYVLRAVRNVFMPGRPRGPQETPKSKYTLRDLAIVVGWQIGLLGGLTLAIGWWAYPLLWALPVYLFTYAADISRVILEHSTLEDDDEADRRGRMVTYTSNPLERAFFAPMNMNFHAAHHLWPQIPYYNLPAADRLMRASPACDARLEWRESYLRHLFAFVRSRPSRAPSGAPRATA